MERKRHPNRQLAPKAIFWYNKKNSSKNKNIQKCSKNSARKFDSEELL